MNNCERIRRLKTATHLTFEELGEVFGVSLSTVQRWHHGTQNMNPEFHATLLRLECDNLPALAPGLRPETVKAFYAGRMGSRS